MNKIINITISIVLAVFLIGCASAPPMIPLSSTFYDESDKKIGIVYSQAPVAETQYTGSIGLLDYGIISAVNSGLDKHLKALTFPEYEQFVHSLKPLLEDKGFSTVVVAPEITSKESDKLKDPKDGLSKNDFSTYREQYDVDMLLIVQFHSIGTSRSYYGPAPTSEPIAMSRMTVRIVDLHSKQLHLYSRVNASKVIPLPWDESDSNYPNLTNAVYQSVDEAFRVSKLLLTSNNKSTVEPSEIGSN